MLSRILVLLLFVSTGTVFAGEKKSAVLDIGVSTCEAYPEDCVQRGEKDFYRILASVKGTELAIIGYHTSAKKVKWKKKAKLSKADSAKVAELVERLQGVEVVRESFDSVCEMAVMPSMFVDLLSTLGENGKLRPVLGPSGCWVYDKIYPKTDRDAALLLKQLLRPLAVKLAFRASLD